MKRYQLYYKHPIFGLLFVKSESTQKDFKKLLDKINVADYKDYSIYIKSYSKQVLEYTRGGYITIPYFRNVFLGLSTNISYEPDKYE